MLPPTVQLGRVLTLSFAAGYWSGALKLKRFDKLIAEKSSEVFVEFEGEVTLNPVIHKAIEWLIANEEAMYESTFNSLVAGYRTLCAKQKFVPFGDVPAKVVETFDLRSICFHPLRAKALPYIGLVFGCEIEQEHGAGLLMHGTRCVSNGSADKAILSWIAERDANTFTGKPKPPAKASGQKVGKSSPTLGAPAKPKRAVNK